MITSPFDTWTLRDLEVAVAIGRQGGFSAAARSLRLSPSSVTRTVARLERDLGAPLFRRTTRRVRVTETGARFLARAERALRELAEAGHEAGEAESTAVGRLRVACSATLGARFLVPRLSSFHASHPRVELDLRFSDRRVDLLREEVDLALRLGRLEDSSLILHPIAPEQRWLYATPGYLARHGTPAVPSDLRAHECLFLGEDRRWPFRVGRRTESVEVQGSLRTDLGEVLLGAALESMGIARLSAWHAHHALSSGELVRVLPEATAASWGVIGALRPPSRVPSAKLEAFLAFLDDELAPALRATLLPVPGQPG